MLNDAERATLSYTNEKWFYERTEIVFAICMDFKFIIFSHKYTVHTHHHTITHIECFALVLFLQRKTFGKAATSRYSYVHMDYV